MLEAIPWKSCRITKTERKGDCLFLYSERGMHRIEPKAAGIARVTYTERAVFSEREKPGVVRKSGWGDWDYREDEQNVVYCSTKLQIVIHKKSASFAYYDGKGVLLLREREKESKELEEFQSYELAGEEGTVIEKIVTPDGAKEVIKEAARVKGEKFFIPGFICNGRRKRLCTVWDSMKRGY